MSESSASRKVVASAALGLALAAGTASVASAEPGSAKVERIGSSVARLTPVASPKDGITVIFETVI
jgi:hypothetical protein